MKKLILLSGFLLLAVSCNKQSPPMAVSAPPTYNYSHQMQIGAQTLMVEISSTAAEQEQGLSDRNSMGQNQGMLFDFGSGASLDPAFWMKDMDFNLDFIWLYQNKIVGITSDAPAQVKGTSDATLPLYYPPSPVNQVVEANAGWAGKNNIKVGDKTKILN